MYYSEKKNRDEYEKNINSLRRYNYVTNLIIWSY